MFALKEVCVRILGNVSATPSSPVETLPACSREARLCSAKVEAVRQDCSVIRHATQTLCSTSVLSRQSRMRSRCGSLSATSKNDCSRSFKVSRACCSAVALLSSSADASCAQRYIVRARSPTTRSSSRMKVAKPSTMPQRAHSGRTRLWRTKPTAAERSRHRTEIRLRDRRTALTVLCLCATASRSSAN